MLHQHCLEPNSPTEHSTCLLIFKAALRLLTLKAAAPGSAMLCRCSRTPTGQHLFCPLCCPNSAREGPFRPPLWDEEVGQGRGKHSQAAFSFYKTEQKPWICQIHHIFKNLCFSLQKKSVQNKEKYPELPLD